MGKGFTVAHQAVRISIGFDGKIRVSSCVEKVEEEVI